MTNVCRLGFGALTFCPETLPPWRYWLSNQLPQRCLQNGSECQYRSRRHRAAHIHFHGLTRVLDIVVDFTPDPLAPAILGLHRTAPRPRTSHVIEALLRQGWCGGKNCLQEYASQYATNGCSISKH